MSAATSPTVPAGSVLRGYRFALDPTPVQAEALRSHCGAQRFAYNWGLRIIKANLDQRAAERSYGIAEEALTPLTGWSGYGLRKSWNQVKDEVAPWWAENSKEAYSSGLAHLAVALSNWAASKSGDRRGPRMGFPRFKTRKVPSVVPVQHRGVRPGRRHRSAPCEAAPDRGDAYPRIHPETGAPP